MDVTALVPIDLIARSLDITRRAINLAKVFSGAGFKIIFAHNDRGCTADRSFVEAIGRGKYPGVTVVSEGIYSGVVNASKLRNFGAYFVQTELVLLLDVDIWPDVELFKRRAQAVSISGGFDMVPCLYLTQRGTESIQRSNDYSSLIEKYYNFGRGLFLHLAAPSSIITLRKASYEAILGFDESFEGHGFEDFDFMVRLAQHYNELDAGNDFLEDMAARSPLFAEGFRRDLARACIPALINKDLALHLYHPKGDLKVYQGQRRSNYSRFAEKYYGLSHEAKKGSRTLIPEFVTAAECRGGSVSDYGIYFDNKPGHVDRFDTFKKRLRFLING